MYRLGDAASREGNVFVKIVYMTREYPPHVYGGAGVHVEHLTRQTARMAEVEVKCFGDQYAPCSNPSVKGYPFHEGLFQGNPLKVKQAFMALQTCLHFNATPIEADVVHTHTWYAAWGGLLAKLGYGIPLVVTVHSLEPLRPWKREQLGRGYDVSSWVERAALEAADAVIAVSENDRREILTRFAVDPERVTVVPNGIDHDFFRPVAATDWLTRYGVDPKRRYVLFLGRVSRQKGIHHFVRAAHWIDPNVQIVLCAGSPDTVEMETEIQSAWTNLQRARPHTLWIREMVPREAAVQLYSHAAVFCCPSIYEPFGIINLEAMACETPVVASAVGGIPDVVVDGETGMLVPFTRRSADDPEPADPERFARELAEAVNTILRNPERGKAMGRKGRERVIADFGWDRVAERVMAVYRRVCDSAEAMDASPAQDHQEPQ